MTARAVPRPPALQRLKLINANTGEKFSGAYRDDNGPIPAAVDDLCLFLRDFHSGAEIAMDIGVIDFLAAVLAEVGEAKATILSAYRTPATNAMLARTTFGVAENSQHMYGRALDLRLDTKLAEAMAAARAMRRGGVGWYPYSGFIHIDTGPVRNWTLDERRLDDLLRSAPRARPPAGKPSPSAGLGRPAGTAEQHTQAYRQGREEFLGQLGIRLGSRR